MTTRVLLFARAIIAGHTRHAAFRSRLLRVLARRSRIVVRTQARRSPGRVMRRHEPTVVRVHLTLRLATDGACGERSTDARRIRGPAALHRSASLPFVARDRLEARRVAVDRLTGRTRRIDRPVAPSPTVMPAPLASVPRSLRAGTLPYDAPAPASSRSVGAPARAILDPLEVSRVAAAVMQSIDHRLLAYRERRGRV